MNQNVQMAPAEEIKKVDIHHLAEKFKSKAELHNFLSLDCKAYLPTMRSINIFFFK
jgi:hypothetical protein